MDIPLSILLLLCLIFLIIGAVIMLLFQYYIYLRFSNLPEESEEQKNMNAKYSLPLGMLQSARAINATSSSACTSNSSLSSSSSTMGSSAGGGGNISGDPSALISLNFVMQFLFHELKNSNRVRKWFYRKLSLELDELIAKTTTGKLFDKLTIKELELGDQFPEMKTLRVHNVELNNCEGRIENLDLLLELHYAGNFRTTIDADMVLGKKGSLTLKVKQLSGMARLQFTRKPYTHWSLSFLGDPELDLAVESKYQGRQMQSNITSLISNQIRKAVRRKHTLPNYKLRYKPFFHKTPDEELGDSDLQPNGLLEVKVAELSRLTCLSPVTEVYCTLTMASLPFVEARQRDDRNVIVSLDVEIHKAKNQQIGLIFKQNAEQCVEIEAVLPNTPACKSDLHVGDIVLAIDGKRIASIQQVAKVVKGLHNSVFSLRIERVIPGIIRNDAILEDLELYEDLGDLRVSYSGGNTLKPNVEPIIGFGADTCVKQLMTRHNSGERGTSSESSLNNTPTSSPKKSKLIAKALKKTINRDTGGSDSSNNRQNQQDDESKSKTAMPTATSSKLLQQRMDERLRTMRNVSTTAASTGVGTAGDGVNDVEHYHQHSTVDCALRPLIHMDDLSHFKLSAQSRYLNVCVYGKSHGEPSLLLGFVNISLNQILAECCETSLSQCLKILELNPPIPQDIKSYQLSNQSGFNPNLCFGDILFAFTWDGNPNMLATTETPSKLKCKSKVKSGNQASDADDNSTSGVFTADSSSLKSTSSEATTISNTASVNQTRAHNFIRTHFQRATQCDFCGKKIWLKDAVQCHDCFMCCHKKCITKCQNATVCGPVDCSSALAQQPSVATTPTAPHITNPEFTVTQADNFETVEAEEAFPALSQSTGDNQQLQQQQLQQQQQQPQQTIVTTSAVGLEVHRSSLTGLLAQGIKRVNSANNLAIPGIVSSLTGSSNSNNNGASNSAAANQIITNTKSLPPSPQHTPSRKSSLVMKLHNPFELVTQSLESLSPEVVTLTAEQIGAIVEPILSVSKEEDVMTLAKYASKQLYVGVVPKERVDRINLLLSKLRLALDSETALHSSLTTSNVTGISSSISTSSSAVNVAAGESQKKSSPSPTKSANVDAAARSEERVQALSVIMLYLCTGLQHAQGVAPQ